MIQRVSRRTADYEITGFSPELQSDIVDLRARVFGGQRASNAAYLDWKYARNPYIEQPLFYVALWQGRVVGMRGMFGSRWQVGDQPAQIDIPCGAEFAVDAEHRGRGLPKAIMDFALADLERRQFACMLSLSASHTTRLLQIRAGWRLAARFEVYQRGDFSASTASPRQRREARRPNLLRRLRGTAASARSRPARASPFECLDRWSAKVRGPIHVATVARSSEMAALVGPASEGGRINHVRDRRFYEWRFNDPSSHYRFLYHEDGGGINGFFVLQQHSSGGAVTVADWAASAGQVWSDLLNAVIDSGTNRLRIGAAAFSLEEMRLLRRHSFERVEYVDTRGQPAPGIYSKRLKNIDSDRYGLTGPALSGAEHWDFRLICSDAF